MSWREDGMTMDEYRNFVHFATPQAASEVIYAAMSERHNLNLGSSGGYVSSGAAYSGYSPYIRFTHGGSSIVEDMLSKLRSLAIVSDAYGALNNWATPEAVSGGALRYWGDNFGDLLSSAGLSDFADPNNRTSFTIPAFYPANAASAYIGIASAISLLQYSTDFRRNYYTPNVSIHVYVDKTSGWDGDYEHSYYWESSEGTREDVYTSNRYGIKYILWTKGISGRLSNHGLYVSSIFSAVISGGAKVMSGEFSGDYDSNNVPLSTIHVSSSIAPGGVEYFPVSGYYTYGKTVEELIPAESHWMSVGGVDPVGKSSWIPRAGFVNADSGLSATTLNMIGESSIFFGGTQTVQ